jgi:hypothetical protein
LSQYRSSFGQCEAAFLKALQESAAGLSRGDAAAEKFERLTERCAADGVFSPEHLQFLLADAKPTWCARRIRATRKSWKSRLQGVPPRFVFRPRIAILLPDGQSIRTFLLTDVCRRISGWCDLYVLSPHGIEAEVTALGPNARYLPIPNIRRNRFDYLVGYLGYLHVESPTTRQFVRRLDENLERTLASGQTPDGSLRIWQIARELHSPTLYEYAHSWSLRFFAQLYCLQAASALLEWIQPDFLFNTTIVSWPARLWTRAAALAGIPILTNVLSWDNMSTKTMLDEFVDTFLVWSEEMDEDFAMSLPFVRDKRRVIVGSPQFEPVIQGQGLLPRADFLGRFGLDPAKSLVLYTTGSKTLFPYEADCLDRLLGHWRENLQSRAGIMVRMHPKDRDERYAAVMAKYPEVPFTFAGESTADGEDWVPTRADLALLVNQLNHCSVVINMASTMTLEGFAVDKPAINIGFTLGPSLSARYPMEDYYQSRHYRDIVESGSVSLVRDYQQLFEAIHQVLDGRGFDVSLQRRILQKKCSRVQDASARIDALLRSYAGRRGVVAAQLKQLRLFADGLMKKVRAA